MELTMTIDKDGVYRPRFTFEISEEQSLRANRLITTFGLRRAIMSIVLDDVLDLIEKHGQMVIGIILDGAAKPHEILPTLAKAKNKSEE